MKLLYKIITFKLLLISGFAIAAENLVINGDFEIEVIPLDSSASWVAHNIADDPGENGGWKANEGNPGGAFSLVTWLSVASPYIYQNIEGLIVGDNYRLSFDYKINITSSSSANRTLQVDSGNKIIAILDSTQTWQSVEYIVTADDYDMFMTFEVINPSTTIGYMIDNVVFEPYASIDIFSDGFEQDLNGGENTGVVRGNAIGVTSSGMKLELLYYTYQPGDFPFKSDLYINASGEFVFPIDIPIGAHWEVTLPNLPDNPQQQSCNLSNQKGIMQLEGSNHLVVTCDAVEWNWDEMNWGEGGWN